MENRQIAERLEAFGSLLELAEANSYTIRAYRRAAETIREAALPVAELVASGRVRELRGVGPGVETRLRGVGATGSIARPAGPEREAAPGPPGLRRLPGGGGEGA